MADDFTVQEIKEIRQCFELYARKKYIDREAQLRFIMRTLGHVTTTSEIRDYMRRFGPKIHLPEFLEILALDRQRSRDPVWEVAKAFHNLDENKSGFINRTRLFHLLTGFGEQMETVEVVNALERMQLAGHGLKIPITEIISHISG